MNTTLIKIKNFICQKFNLFVAELQHGTPEDCVDLIKRIPKNRLPDDVLEHASKSLRKNASFMAGYVFFAKVKKDNPLIHIFYTDRRVFKIMSSRGTCAVDVYKIVNGNYSYYHSVYAKEKNAMYVSKRLKGIKEGDTIALLLPSFAKVRHIYLKKSDFEILPDIEHKKTLSVYGSSVSQGCAATRSGLNYVNQLRTVYNYDVKNFGFSESAKGEKEIVEYIAKQHSAIYILEYDHNADVETLRKTHRNVYKTVRDNNPDALIVLLSRISAGVSISMEEAEERFDIIHDTYLYALSNNDNKIALIKGSTLVSGEPKKYIRDTKHPNDKGMEIIVKAIHEELLKLGETD